MGVLRRSSERGKTLPEKLDHALKIQSGMIPLDRGYGNMGHAQGIDGHNGELTGDVSSTLGTNCGMSTGRNGVMVPRAAGVVTKGNGDCFLTEERHTALSTGGGQAGQGYPCILTPVKASADVLCLNDQGGQFMSSSENVAGTLRAQMHSHQPLVLATQQGGAEIGVGVCPTITASAGMSGNNQPVLYESQGQDSRYTGPSRISSTLTARAGTGGNNLPLVEQELTPAVFSYQRTDQLVENDVVSTESSRQCKDATDLVMQPYQETVGSLVRSDHHGIGNQYVNDDKCIVEGANLIRRLTPLECERLQGFPDGWTDIPSASDSARYKALGNSVAIPCVEFVMGSIAKAIRSERNRRRGWMTIKVSLVA